jgi:uncharacterized protein with von Willebrand factor type A (vWA) domain
MAQALAGNIVRFIDVLRAQGVAVYAGQAADAATALAEIGVTRRLAVRAALRSLLVHQPGDIRTFDETFERFWRACAPGTRRTRPARPATAPDASSSRPRAADAAMPVLREDAVDSSGASPRRAVMWSPVEALRTRDFAALSPEELVQAEALLSDLPWRLGMRHTRRWAPAAAGRLDLRAALRANMKHGGELLLLPRRARRSKPRPVVVLADVSGSMERYARMLLQFVHGMTAGPNTVESFVFATRLTKITRALQRRGGGAALASVAGRIRDWGGGTRIGEALRTFNLHHARRVMRHGPVVLVISDGWDRGDPAQLAQELARVRRSCRRLIWLNPLLGSSAYEPLTRGMQAALPLVDDFLPAHNVASLEQLAARLRDLPARGRPHARSEA